MLTRPVVVALDDSDAGRAALELARYLVSVSGVDCLAVHAVREPLLPAEPAGFEVDLAAMGDAAAAAADTRLREYFGAGLEGPPCKFEVRFGRAATVLREAAAGIAAGLVVIGGKRHGAAARMLSGSTAHDLVRTSDAPLMVAAGGGPIRRILVALDVSEAAGQVWSRANAIASTLRASVRVVHVVEPLPDVIGSTIDRVAWEKAAGDAFDDMLRSLTGLPVPDSVILHGPAAEMLAAEAARWDADLLVLGSHGKGWVDRVLLGSVTERLLAELPCSLLVIRITAPARRPVVL